MHQRSPFPSKAFQMRRSAHPNSTGMGLSGIDSSELGLLAVHYFSVTVLNVKLCIFGMQIFEPDTPWQSLENEVMLESTLEEKDLGVWIDVKLKFTSHVGHVAARSNEILGLIKRTFIYKDTDVIKTLFTALVRPHPEYANTVWYPRLKKWEERPSLLMLYDIFHIKRDYKFWICHPWYTVDIAEIWLKYTNYPWNLLIWL